LDAARGCAIINVVIFHFFYDHYVVSGLNPAWRGDPLVVFWQLCSYGSFVLIAGMAFHLSRNNLIRGLKLNLFGLLITLVTCIFAPRQAIYFGILNFLGCALWVTEALKKILIKCPAGFGALCSLLLYILGMIAADAGFIGTWPDFLAHNVFIPFGWHGEDFHSADYVPLLPHIFLFWSSWYFYLWLDNAKEILSCGDVPLLTWCGRHSLAIYLLHQPVFFFLGVTI
ncbi:MAG: DUF1624 domain-containing protein, partial [Phascolarctobacterium sp.]|nr:DUF1624 domain-containing protein [Phascolarctobacterium sp.]